MNKTQEIPWKRITAEAVAIVGSILLAFAIDAWWQQKNEVELEGQLLQALLDDFESTKAEISNWRSFHVAVESSTKSLLNHAIAQDSSISQNELQLLIANITWFDSASHFATAALNSLIFGGELSQISNDSLRQILADWPTRISSAESTQRQDTVFFYDVLTPFLRAHVSLPQLASESSVRPGQSSSQIIFPKIEAEIGGEANFDQLLANEEFQNILMQKTWIQFDILQEIYEIELLLDKTIELLTSEIGDP